LDGPALYSQESALLRSYFLTTSPDHASFIIYPLVQLCLVPTYTAVDLDVVSENLLIVCSDTCSLIPDAIALIDTGDNIVIRVGTVNIDGKIKDYLLKKLISKANQRAAGRNPIPKLTILERPWSANDRLVFSRLSPSHRDSREFRVLTSSIKTLVSAATVDKLITYLPHTDQLTYYMYLWKCIPRYAKIYEKYHRSLLSAPNNDSMNRDTKNIPNVKTSYKRKSLLQWLTGIRPSDEDINDNSDDEIILSLP